MVEDILAAGSVEALGSQICCGCLWIPGSVQGQAQQQRNLDNIVSQQPRIGGGKKSKKEFSASSELEVKNTSPMSEQDSGILDVEDEDEEEEVPGAQDLVDFSPVYRCLHIYSVLSFDFPPRIPLWMQEFRYSMEIGEFWGGIGWILVLFSPGIPLWMQ
ncbi:hypothetical protein DUI87_22118 [Hirundo rustica rustica]|uniref:Uncharacterized protein n=1 Tax=Hirundo rustica rustica TaxID=333673 RepID=A0A3M0JKH0_HIRRU|nr:hypothetical protein DUI87_22118 [Hirundo rustica rustica]